MDFDGDQDKVGSCKKFKRDCEWLAEMERKYVSVMSLRDIVSVNLTSSFH